jgi:hypothetical protein
MRPALHDLLLEQVSRLMAGGVKPKVYIAGAMSGVARKNIPAFLRAEKYFSSHGFDVLSPVWNEMQVMQRYGKRWQTMTSRQKWAAYMKADLRLVRQADVVAGMDLGVFGSRKSWMESSGVRAEKRYAESLGIPFVGIRPPRGGHAPWMPKRDVMKPHPPEFPGGRAQDWRGSPEKRSLSHDLFGWFEGEGVKLTKKQRVAIRWNALTDPEKTAKVLEHLHQLDPERRPKLTKPFLKMFESTLTPEARYLRYEQVHGPGSPSGSNISYVHGRTPRWERAPGQKAYQPSHGRTPEQVLGRPVGTPAQRKPNVWRTWRKQYPEVWQRERTAARGAGTVLQTLRGAGGAPIDLTEVSDGQLDQLYAHFNRQRKGQYAGVLDPTGHGHPGGDIAFVRAEMARIRRERMRRQVAPAVAEKHKPAQPKTSPRKGLIAIKPPAKSVIVHGQQPPQIPGRKPTTPFSGGSALSTWVRRAADDDPWVTTLYDVESEGLRRTGKFGREPHHALRQSQVAWRTPLPGGKVIKRSYYTQIFDDERLKYWGVNLESTGLGSGKTAREMVLPKGFIKEMMTPRGGRAGFFDVGIAEPDNPLFDIFRRHLEFHLRTPEQERSAQWVVQEQLMDLLEGPLDVEGIYGTKGKRLHQFGLRHGAKRTLAAWNLSFDWGRTVSDTRGTGLSYLLEELEMYKKAGKFRHDDSRTRWAEFVFDMMKDDPEYAPRYTVTRRINALRAKLAPGAVPTTEQLYGLTTTHDSLRAFLDDWVMAGRQSSVGESGKIWKERLGEGPVADKVADILARASQAGTFHDYERAAVQIRDLSKTDPSIGKEAVRLIDRTWKPAQGHMSILGKATRGRETDLYETAFHYVLGGKQAHLVDLFSGMKTETGDPFWPDLVKIIKSQEYIAHEAVADAAAEQSLVNLFQDLNRPDADPGRIRTARQALKEENFLAAGVMENLRNRGVGTGVPDGPIPTAGSGGKVITAVKDIAAKHMGGWRTAAAGVAFGGGLLYMLTERNRELEGVRQPDTIWREVEGISPSGDTRSDFGSGRNPLAQLLGTPYSPQVQWIPAGQLGMRGDQLYQAILEDSPESETLRKGAWVGRVVAQALGGQIAGQEHYVSDPYLGIHGYIDILLQSGIPMEVKTVASLDQLKGLKAPKRAAVSQANFYAHAIGAPYSYVAYFARDDPSQYRLFRVDYDSQRIMTDRQVVMEAYDTALELGQYQSTASGNMRILQANGLEKVWSNFKSNIMGVERYGPTPALYPRATNAFDAVAPLRDYGHYKHTKYRMVGHGGFVQSMHYSAKGSRIRDQKTRLQRVNPMVPQTPRPVCHPNGSRCEAR